jgi:fatty acid desaturase
MRVKRLGRIRHTAWLEASNNPLLPDRALLLFLILSRCLASMLGAAMGTVLEIAGAPRGAKAVEWPTAALAVLIYGGWAAVTWWHAALPAWLVAALGAWLVAWHSSLQHETIHGHPTRWRAINRLLGFPPLMLWLPYDRYRDTHLQHHRDEQLTDPLEDPESAYRMPEQLERLHPLVRVLIEAQTTLLGRLVLGPAWSIGRFLGGEFRAILAGDPEIRRVMAVHLVAIVPIIFWITVVCGMNLGFYLVAIVYPGTAFILLRSFAEHRAAERVSQRTAIVENSWILGPLFLFNNLHAAHHECPGLQWYALPGWYRRNRDRLIAQNGGLVYDSYFSVARRFLLSSHDAVAHPFARLPPPQPGF